MKTALQSTTTAVGVWVLALVTVIGLIVLTIANKTITTEYYALVSLTVGGALGIAQNSTPPVTTTVSTPAVATTTTTAPPGLQAGA